MSKPAFRLQSILRLREDHRDECRNELARAIQASQILQERRADVHGEMEQLQRELRRQHQAGDVQPDAVLSSRRYEIVLKSQVMEFSKQIDQVEEEVERRRQTLAEADREVRVLEKLKERRQQEFEAKQRKQEQAILDELAGARFQEAHSAHESAGEARGDES